MFTDREKDYIIYLLGLSKESLDDCFDAEGKLAVDFLTQEDCEDEYDLINTILAKLDVMD